MASLEIAEVKIINAKRKSSFIDKNFVLIFICPSVGRMVRWSVTCLYFLLKVKNGFLYKNHRGGPTLTFLNLLGVLNVLNVLNTPKDASLVCWALFSFLPNLTV